METRIIFFILAGLLIAILVGYSLWSARREKSRIDTFSSRPASPAVGSHKDEYTGLQSQENIQPQPLMQEVENSEVWASQQQEIENQVQEIKIQLSQPSEPAYNSTNVYVEQPEISEPVQAPVEQQVENRLITLYVVAPEGSAFNGLQVVRKLEELGLFYGQYQIFHRHLDNQSSPVLFSVANMMQPGVFELNEIEHFSTIGLVFFMQLPSPTNNDVANLRMMINTVESFAQSMGGFVLDENHQLFDEQSRQQYLLSVKNS